MNDDEFINYYNKICPITACTLPLSDWGLNLLPNFQKGRDLQDLYFERVLLGKRRVTLFRGLQFLQKKLKSEIFNDKKNL